MNSNYSKVLSAAARTALTGALTASTLLLGQNTTVPAPAENAPANTQSPVDSNGWKRVGDNAQVQNPNPDSGQGYDQSDGLQGQPNASYSGADAQTAPSPQGPYNNQSGYNQQPTTPYNQPRTYGAQQQGAYPAPPPVPAQLTLQSGTYVTVRVNQMLSSDKNQPGDAFTASLIQPLVVNGVVVAEPGQILGGRIVTAQKHHSDQPGRLGLQLTNMTLVDGQQIPLVTTFVSTVGRKTAGGAEVGTVATTTAVGAAIGAAAGWGTGAAIGAGAGAAAGLIGVMITHNHASVVYPEQILTFRIEAPLTISTERSSQAFRYVQPNEYDRPTYTNQAGGSYYESAAPPSPVYNTYAYGYPYDYGYGWGYPYWGTGIGFYWGGYPYRYWGGGYPYRYWGGGRYYGGRYYGSRGNYGGNRGYAGNYRAPVGGFRGGVGGGRVGGGHR